MHTRKYTYSLIFMQLTLEVEASSHDGHDLCLEDITNNDVNEDTLMLYRSRRHILNTAHTLKGFNVPRLEVDKDKTFEMINLPSRSVLKKKRKDLKTKVKNVSLVMNRKSDANVDNNYYNVSQYKDFDSIAEDMWKEFDNSDEEDNLLNDDIDASHLNERSGFAKNKTVIYMKIKLNSVLTFLSIPFRYFYEVMHSCGRKIISCMRREKNSQKIYDENFKNNDENEMKIENENENINDVTEYTEIKSIIFEEGEEEENIVILVPENMNDDDPLDFSLMSFEKALFYGYLNKGEYSVLLIWYGSMVFIALFGVILGNTVAPQFLGYVIWFSIWLIITTCIPIIQYFNTYELSMQMKQLIGFSLFFHVLFCVMFFVFKLDMTIREKASVWILDFLVLFPLFLYILVNLLIWRDNNYKDKIIEKKVEKKTIKNKLKKIGKLLCQSYPFFLLIIVLFNVEFYIYISILGGEILTVLILVSIIGFQFLKNWTENDFYMSKSLIKLGSLFLQIAAVVSFFGKKVFLDFI